jgi:hypothetical protein
MKKISPRRVTATPKTMDSPIKSSVRLTRKMKEGMHHDAHVFQGSSLINSLITSRPKK